MRYLIFGKTGEPVTIKKVGDNSNKAQSSNQGADHELQDMTKQTSVEGRDAERNGKAGNLKAEGGDEERLANILLRDENKNNCLDYAIDNGHRWGKISKSDNILRLYIFFI